MYTINDLHWQSQLEQSYNHRDSLTRIATNMRLNCIENNEQTEPIFKMDPNIKSWCADKNHYDQETGLRFYVYVK